MPSEDYLYTSNARSQVAFQHQPLTDFSQLNLNPLANTITQMQNSHFNIPQFTPNNSMISPFFNDLTINNFLMSQSFPGHQNYLQFNPYPNPYMLNNPNFLQSWSNNSLPYGAFQVQPPPLIAYPNRPSCVLDTVTQQIPAATISEVVYNTQVINPTAQPKVPLSSSIKIQHLPNLNISEPLPNVKITEEEPSPNKCNSEDTREVNTPSPQSPFVTSEQPKANNKQSNVLENLFNFNNNAKEIITEKNYSLKDGLIFVNDGKNMSNDKIVLKKSDSEYTSSLEDSVSLKNNNLEFKTSTQNDMSTSKNSTTPCQVGSCGKVFDSWEDIEPDDTPIRAEYFSDFKPINVDIMPQTSKLDVNNSDDLEEKRVPVNWKDTFNPDFNEKSKRLEKFSDSMKPSSVLNIDMKKVLVHKLDLENKRFHLICVNNKLAILPYELFPQITNLHMHTVCQIVELTQEKFPLITKEDYPLVFSELEKSTFSSDLDKKKILRLKKASIVYLSDMKKLFTLLKLEEKHQIKILDKLEKILQEFIES